MHTMTVRPVEANEWREIREFRLRALADDEASIAFLDSADEVSARPDEFWQERARLASADAGPGATYRQFVGVTDDGVWAGSLTVLLERAGEDDFEGLPILRSGGGIVGVYVFPEFRGAGVLHALCGAAFAWIRERGYDHARLVVHVDNLRAQRAYAKEGFTLTGRGHEGPIGPEREMVRAL